MQKAKQAVSEFLSHDGHHQTSVDENIRPAVTEEHIKPHQHENVTTAVNKDIHKEHHQTVVQPIKAKETLPEKHTHKVAPVEHRTFNHGGGENLQATLERDASKYKNTSTTHNTTHSTTAAPIVTGERVHHHVHEHIQPVIEKETIAPEVVHKTVPIHETHHAAPIHHETTVLPTKTLEEFNNGKGTLHGGSRTKVGEFEGCPKTPHEARSLEGGNSANATKNGHNVLKKHEPETTTNSLSSKPSLKDKLNPFVDADGDGKKGFLD